MNKKVLALVASVTLLVSSSAFALSLDEAKRSGAVGEKADGYLAPVKGGSAAEINQLVATVNEKRKTAYSQIAQKNGSPMSVVEKVGAKEAIEKSPAGTFIQAGDGSWIQKN